jgi:hypothetical protein
MPRINVNANPYELDLFCPFCGEQIVGGGDEGFADSCDHTICVGPDDDGADDITDSDIVFVAFESAPACREHIFAFRQPT